VRAPRLCRVLDGVAHEVEQHLCKALLVAEANRERLVYGSRKRELLVLDKRLRCAHRFDAPVRSPSIIRPDGTVVREGLLQ